MPSYIQSSFSGGEVAPEYSGRTDLPVYKEALARARNMVVLRQAGLTRRPGFRRVAGSKFGAAQPVRMEGFSPASGVKFTLEFGPGYIRFFRKRAPVLLAGVPFEIATPYAAGDLDTLSPTKLIGRMFLWSAAHPTQVLTWNGPLDSDWTIAAALFVDGPYLDAVAGGATITPSAAGAAATLTASATTGINGGAGFRADDVGRLIRAQTGTFGLNQLGGITATGVNYSVGDLVTVAGGVSLRPATLTITAIGGGGGVTFAKISDPGQYLSVPANPLAQASTTGLGTGFRINTSWDQTHSPSVWLSGTITARTSATVVDVTIGALVLDAIGNTIAGQFVDTAALKIWRLGAWCPYEGYPQTGGSNFQRRLLAGANTRAPKRLWTSQTDLPLGMAPTLGTGQVIDTSAIAFDIDDDQAEPIVWISPAGSAQIPQIGIGSGDAEFIVQAVPTGAALTPTNVQVYKETKYTSSAVRPLRIGRALLFADSGGQRLRQWTYLWQAGGYVGPDASPYGSHLLRGRVKALDYALSPQPIVWLVTRDGGLAGLTYVLDEANAAIAAWHSHALGGAYYGAAPLVDSLAVSPAEDSAYDEVWLCVSRADPAGATRTIEVSTPFFRNMPLDQAVFVDSAISSPLTYPPAICTPDPDTPFEPSGNTDLPARGDFVGFAFSADVAVAGDLTPGTVLRINNGTFRLTEVAGPRIVTAQVLDVPASLAPRPANSWSYTRMATVFTGFAAHNGRALAILGDGALYAPQTVAGGTITLDSPASYVTAGLAYDSEFQTLDLDLPAPDGTSQMKTGRLDHLYLRVFETAGGAYGPDAEHLDAVEPRDADDLLDWAPLPISDDLRLPMPGGSSEHRTVFVRQRDPWPLTVLALVVKGGTTEQAPR